MADDRGNTSSSKRKWEEWSYTSEKIKLLKPSTTYDTKSTHFNEESMFIEHIAKDGDKTESGKSGKSPNTKVKIEEERSNLSEGTEKSESNDERSSGLNTKIKVEVDINDQDDETEKRDYGNNDEEITHTTKVKIEEECIDLSEGTDKSESHDERNGGFNTKIKIDAESNDQDEEAEKCDYSNNEEEIRHKTKVKIEEECIDLSEGTDKSESHDERIISLDTKIKIEAESNDQDDETEKCDYGNNEEEIRHKTKVKIEEECIDLSEGTDKSKSHDEENTDLNTKITIEAESNDQIDETEKRGSNNNEDEISRSGLKTKITNEDENNCANESTDRDFLFQPFPRVLLIPVDRYLSDMKTKIKNKSNSNDPLEETEGDEYNDDRNGMKCSGLKARIKNKSESNDPNESTEQNEFEDDEEKNLNTGSKMDVNWMKNSSIDEGLGKRRPGRGRRTHIVKRKRVKRTTRARKRVKWLSHEEMEEDEILWKIKVSEDDVNQRESLIADNGESRGRNTGKGAEKLRNGKKSLKGENHLEKYRKVALSGKTAVSPFLDRFPISNLRSENSSKNLTSSSLKTSLKDFNKKVTNEIHAKNAIVDENSENDKVREGNNVFRKAAFEAQNHCLMKNKEVTDSERKLSFVSIASGSNTDCDFIKNSTNDTVQEPNNVATKSPLEAQNHCLIQHKEALDSQRKVSLVSKTSGSNTQCDFVQNSTNDMVRNANNVVGKSPLEAQSSDLTQHKPEFDTESKLSFVSEACNSNTKQDFGQSVINDNIREGTKVIRETAFGSQSHCLAHHKHVFSTETNPSHISKDKDLHTERKCAHNSTNKTIPDAGIVVRKTSFKASNPYIEKDEPSIKKTTPEAHRLFLTHEAVLDSEKKLSFLSKGSSSSTEHRCCENSTNGKVREVNVADRTAAFEVPNLSLAYHKEALDAGMILSFRYKASGSISVCDSSKNLTNNKVPEVNKADRKTALEAQSQYITQDKPAHTERNLPFVIKSSGLNTERCCDQNIANEKDREADIFSRKASFEVSNQYLKSQDPVENTERKSFASKTSVSSTERDLGQTSRNEKVTGAGISVGKTTFEAPSHCLKKSKLLFKKTTFDVFRHHLLGLDAEKYLPFVSKFSVSDSKCDSEKEKSCSYEMITKLMLLAPTLRKKELEINESVYRLGKIVGEINKISEDNNEDMRKEFCVSGKEKKILNSQSNNICFLSSAVYRYHSKVINWTLRRTSIFDKIEEIIREFNLKGNNPSNPEISETELKSLFSEFIICDAKILKWLDREENGVEGILEAYSKAIKTIMPSFERFRLKTFHTISKIQDILYELNIEDLNIDPSNPVIFKIELKSLSPEKIKCYGKEIKWVNRQMNGLKRKYNEYLNMIDSLSRADSRIQKFIDTYQID